IEHALHAVAVAAVTGGAQQITGDLEVGVGAARSLKAGVGLGEALADLTATGLAKLLIRSPAAGGETLFTHKVEAVAGRAKMLLAAEHQIGLHGAAHCV